jgi:hypothetical protein
MTDQFSPKPQLDFQFGTDDNEVGTIKAATLAAAIAALESFADGQAAWVEDQDGTRHEIPQVTR